MIALHPTEPLVAVASYFSKIVQVRDLRTGAVVKALTMDQGGYFVAWHPQGHTLAVSETGTGEIRFFDKETYRDLHEKGPPGIGIRFFFSHDGDYLATYGWVGDVDLFEVATWRHLMRVPNAPTKTHLRFSADGRRLAGIFGEGRAGPWKVGVGDVWRQVAMGQDMGNSPSTLSLSHDGRLMATCLAGKIGLLDVRTGASLGSLPMGDDHLRFLAFEHARAVAWSRVT